MALHDILSSRCQRSTLKRNFKKLDKDKFIEDLNNIQWRINDIVNESFDNFLNDFSSLIDKHVPLERLSRRDHKLSQKPWLTRGILNSIKHKRQLYYKYFVKGNAEKLLFLMYINDINNCSPVLSFRLFADDTNVFAEHKNLNHLEHVMNRELEQLSDWIKANKLSLNVKKSKFMLITSNKRQGTDQTFSVKIENNTLDRMTVIKFLGVYIDNNLAWREHINIICKKISKNIGAMSKLRHYVDLDTLRIVYYSLVYPYLQYGALIWGNTYKSRLNPINVLNNKAVRIMTFSDYRSHAPPLYKSLKILQFNDVVIIQTALFMFDFYNNLLPKPFHRYFKKINETHSHFTRHSLQNYYLPTVSTNYGKSSLKYLGTKVWSAIDNSLKNLNRFKFKKALKEQCFSTYL